MARKRKVRILFACIGRRVALLQSFRRACGRLGLEGVMIGADSTGDSAALQCCDRRYVVRRVSEPGYARQMRAIIRREGVDLVAPTVDLDLAMWARERERLGREGCTVLVSRPEVVAICQDKRRSCRFLREHGFDTPATFTPEEALRGGRGGYPYFLKPWDGHASRGAYVARNREELRFYARRVPNCIVQEFIKGQEHTVDVLADFEGRVRCAVPRRRLETRAGEVSKAVTVKHPRIMARAKALVEALGAGPGVITIQCFLTAEGRIVFIEINPRFGGGAPLAMAAGADLPRWLLQMWLGQRPRIRLDGWRDGVKMLRYDEAVWVEK